MFISPLEQNDTLFTILSFLEVYEIARCGRVSRYWCNLLRAPQSEEFWEKFYKSRYQRFSESIPSDIDVIKSPSHILSFFIVL